MKQTNCTDREVPEQPLSTSKKYDQTAVKRPKEWIALLRKWKENLETDERLKLMAEGILTTWKVKQKFKGKDYKELTKKEKEEYDLITFAALMMPIIEKYTRRVPPLWPVSVAEFKEKTLARSKIHWPRRQQMTIEEILKRQVGTAQPVEEFVQKIGPPVKEWVGEDEVCLVALLPDGIFYSSALYQWLCEELGKEKLKITFMDKEGVDLNKKALKGRKVLLVDNDIVTGATFRAAMEVIQKEKKLAIKDVKFAVFEDGQNLADFQARSTRRAKFVRWRSFGAYKNSELRALKFPSIAEIDRAIGLIWDDPDLVGVPSDIADGKTLIVPEEAVELFKAKGLRFKVSNVLGPEDLPPEKLAEMRRRYGM